MRTGTKCQRQKVKRNRFSELSQWILLNIGDGMERGKIIEAYFKIERLYCGWYVDPCFTPKEKRNRDRKYMNAQPLITMTLKRLEQRGFVQLIRHGQYVKEIRLTTEGKAIAEKLNYNENIK